MAIKYQEIKNELETTPLNDVELKYIMEAEEHIDSEIKRQFSGNNSISIDLLIPNFNYSMKEKRTISFKEARRKLMRSELEKRYKKAGWDIKVEYDDGLDGPNMSGSDNWILNGKK
jgi:hypothetical protein